jgi:hypothetical protein
LAWFLADADSRGIAMICPDVDDAVDQWVCTGLGQDTKSSCLRDVLFSGLIRDRKAQWFRIETQCESDLAVWYRALHKRQLFKIAQMLAALNFRKPFPPGWVERAEGKLRRMWSCPPCGAGFQYSGPEQVRYCGKTWLCPWCNARRAYRLYEHILETLKQDRPRHRIPAVLCVASDDLHDEASDMPDYADTMSQLRRNLWRMAQRLGATGGLMIHNLEWLGPQRTDYIHYFIHSFHLLCLIDAEAGIDGIEVDHHWGPDRDLCGHAVFVNRFAEDNSSVETQLRRLLFGADRNWPLNAEAIAQGENYDYQWQPVRHERLGWGAACLHQVYQLHPYAWCVYDLLTHNCSRFHLLGTWTLPKRRSVFEALVPTPERLNRHKQGMLAHVKKLSKRRGLDAENRARQAAAADRRHTLLAQIEPAWEKIVGWAAGGLFPKSRYEQIAEFFRAVGISVSERDIRWLSKQLPHK